MNELLPPTKALLRAAKRADGPPLRARDRLACRLANTVAASTLTAGTVAAESSMGSVAHSVGILSLLPTGKLGAVLAVSLGFASGGAVMATAHSFTRAPAVSRPMSQASVSPRDTAPRREQMTTSASSAPSVVIAPDRPNENQRSTGAIAKALRPPPNVAKETKLLGQVQRALSAGNGALAWKLLGLYRRDYGQGALDEEASAAEVFALCAMGQSPRASAAVARFTRQFPESPLGPRVRQSCGIENEGSHFDGRKSPAAVTHE